MNNTKRLIVKLGFCFALIISFLSETAIAQSSAYNQFTSACDKFFGKHIVKGRVDYGGIKKNEQEVETLYKQMGNVNINTLSEDHKKAFYVNAYNLIVIHGVIEDYPKIKPINKEGFFDKEMHLIAGKKLTLDQIEKGELIANLKDPRIHFTLACAAKSCPKLLSKALTPDNLDYQLDIRTKIVLNDDEFVKVDFQNKTIWVSKIFDWYYADFVKNKEELLDYINSYRTSKIPQNYQVKFYEFDWSLNGI